MEESLEKERKDRADARRKAKAELEERIAEQSNADDVDMADLEEEFENACKENALLENAGDSGPEAAAEAAQHGARLEQNVFDWSDVHPPAPGSPNDAAAWKDFNIDKDGDEVMDMKVEGGESGGADKKD